MRVEDFLPLAYLTLMPLAIGGAPQIAQMLSRIFFFGGVGAICIKRVLGRNAEIEDLSCGAITATLFWQRAKRSGESSPDSN